MLAPLRRSRPELEGTLTRLGRPFWRTADSQCSTDGGGAVSEVGKRCKKASKVKVWRNRGSLGSRIESVVAFAESWKCSSTPSTSESSRSNVSVLREAAVAGAEVEICARLDHYFLD